MRVTVGKANEDYKDLEGETEAWGFIPGETEDLGRFVSRQMMACFRHANPAVGADCTVANREPHGKGTKNGPQSDSPTPLLLAVGAEVVQVSPPKQSHNSNQPQKIRQRSVSHLENIRENSSPQSHPPTPPRIRAGNLFLLASDSKCS